MSNVKTAVLGFPRIGRKRELKHALESFWAGRSEAADLLAQAQALRAGNWAAQAEAGIDILPSNDFSLYDHLLDTAVALGAVPERYGQYQGLEAYFALARGTQGRSDCGHNHGHEALEMTKWFDTNYHVIVPDLTADQRFSFSGTKSVEEYKEAKALGHVTRPVIVGPVTFLSLAKNGIQPVDVAALLPRVLPAYAEWLRALRAAGAEWVQIDEPVLALGLNGVTTQALKEAYAYLNEAATGVKLLLTSYFGGSREALELAFALPVAGVHADLVSVPDYVGVLKTIEAGDKLVSLGVINGRNIWRADLVAILDTIEPLIARFGKDRVLIASSASLLHTPIDLKSEGHLPEDLRRTLSFAVQKLEELAILARAVNEGREAVQAELAAASAAIAARRQSKTIHRPEVAARLAALTSADAQRQSPFATRKAAQASLNLPLFPTTTIGSFPQTSEVRKARAQHARGELSAAEYDAFLRAETAQAIRWQEEVDIDVLVHGEFERNDMVQYFAEQLEGYAFTKNGWVQSYGSRYVRPPIIFGDVSRPVPMTVDWAVYAQSLTKRPVKGMLTGPVTMYKWAFVREDVPLKTVAFQIALALRDEVNDLEAAGIRVIQIDEPALREGLPLDATKRADYLDWAVEAFRLSASGVRDDTQIHTHMCYSEFNDIIEAIAALDADVISVETSRSNMELLEAFETFRYPNDIGPGVYDIHSPRVPTVEEIRDRLTRATRTLKPAQIWVNPDCGLKTRGWAETRPALEAMVAAAKVLREQYDAVYL